MLKAVEPNINTVVREVLIPAGLECLAEASIRAVFALTEQVGMVRDVVVQVLINILAAEQIYPVVVVVPATENMPLVAV